MNMRSFAIVLGTVAAACFATANFTACIIVGSGGGTGIGGDTGVGGFSDVASSTSSASVSSSGATMPSTSSSVSSSGSSMCQVQGTTCTDNAQCCKGMCVKGVKTMVSACDCQPDLGCAEAITSADPAQLCDGGNSAMLYDALYTCQCGDAAKMIMGKCQQACAASACANPPMAPDAACGQCLQDTVAGCGNELNMCNNDVP